MGVKMCARHARECVVRRIVVGARASWYAAWRRATKPSTNRGPEIFDLQLSDGSRLGDNAEFIKTFAKIAEFRQTVTSEDTISENAQSNVMTPKQAQAEIDVILNDKSHAYWDKSNIVGRQQAIQRMQELMGMVHGEA